jgi:hypothetical protein
MTGSTEFIIRVRTKGRLQFGALHVALVISIVI